jgi:carotenoid 1,2-hydratase
MDGFVPEGFGAKPDSGTLLRGRERPSRSGAADGGLVGEPRGTFRDSRSGFAKEVPPGGYAWWYVDGISDDGQYGITLIAFVGSVFSPYYFKSDRQSPDDHCALNVCVYGRRGHRWAMTERGCQFTARDEGEFRIGPSEVAWDGDALRFDIDEVATPLPFPVKGRVTLRPQALTAGPLTLDAAGRHRWWPVAPCSQIEVELDRPALRWSGSGYFDMNDGDEALQDGFSFWNWSRISLDGGKRAALLYDVIDRRGAANGLALHVDERGLVSRIEPPKPVRLPRTLWQMRRETRADESGGAKIRSTLEDTPFYTRSLLSTHILGQQAPAMHESLSLDRFRSRWVQALLPYRMPRKSA